MTIGDGIPRRLVARLGNASFLFILTKFYRLVYFEEWREKEQKYHFPDMDRTRDLVNTRQEF
jgi:hypothetical protein